MQIFSRAAARRRSSRKCGLGFEQLDERIALSGTPTVVDVSLGSSQWTPAFVSYLAQQGMGNGGYSIPVGSSNQSVALPWNNVNQIRVKFSEDVRVDSGGLALTGANVTSYSFSDFSYDPQTRIAVWTLSAPLQKDRLLIDLDAGGIDPITAIDGNVLDGDWSNNADVFASGDGVPGGDFQFSLNLLPGDANGSSQVTTADYLQVKALNGKATTSSGYIAKCDVNGSGVIDSTDWQYVLGKVGNSLPTGSPAGTTDDAPTVQAITGISLYSAAVDEVIELWDYFADAEDGASGLTYSIQANTNPSLFDALSINQSTGELTISGATGVSGRAAITLGATDSNGVTTSVNVPIDIGYDNQPPYIQLAIPVHLTGNLWSISGVVNDDSDVSDLIVAFSGAFSTRCSVYPDGTFAFNIELAPSISGNVYAQTADRHGENSNLASAPIGDV